jgi:S1-C subfamily serine protease
MKRVIVCCVLGSCALFGGTAMVAIPLQIGSPATAQGQQGIQGADLATQLGERFEAIARKVGPAVVSIEAVKPPRPAGEGKGKPLEESGSGVLIKNNGYSGYLVLTNNHVISQARPEQITVHLADGRLFRPVRVQADPETDIALLFLESNGNLPIAVLGDSDQARVGRLVLAIGSPFGLNQTVTQGIISARERGQVSLGNTIRIKDFLQTDAAINPGSSGGPLVDMRGEVIGLNTAIASHNGSNSGVAFSIPINLVKRVTKQLLEQGSVARGFLGMQVAQSFEPADALKLGLDRLQGALIERVYPDTPAAVAGLRVNDVVMQVENVAIRDENHLINLISTLPPGQRIRLQVWRNRSLASLDAVVGDWSKAQNRFRAQP